MDRILYFFIVGLVIGGLGTCVGGLLSIIIKNPSNKFVSCILSYTSGIMLSIISFDLLPKAYAISGFFIGILGLCCSLILVFLAEDMIPTDSLNKYQDKSANYFKMSIIIIISLSLHNFPEGVALGSSYVYSDNMGLKIGILIAVHNIPEGMTVGIPLIMAGVSPALVLLITLFTGLPTAFGCVLGAVLGGISDYFIGFCLSTAAGSMLYVTVTQLIPEASSLYKGRLFPIFLLLGFICGCGLSFAI